MEINHEIIAVNGSPRENQNTGTLLKRAVEGALSKGAEVELINLYKLDYKGCVGCFSCKRKGSPCLHSCAVRDELTPVKTLYSCSAYPFTDDWTGYEASDLTGALKRREEVFPSDCEAAYRLGADLAADKG